MPLPSSHYVFPIESTEQHFHYVTNQDKVNSWNSVKLVFKDVENLSQNLLKWKRKTSDFKAMD